MKKAKAILGNIFLGLLLIILSISLYGGINAKISKKGYANLLGFTIFEVATGSMSGTIEVGDVIVVKLGDEVKEGDIIVYQEKESFITHRLIEKGQEKWITKGDANNTEDEPIKPDEVIGRVIKIIPNVGLWKKILTRPEIILSFLLAILFLGLAWNYRGKRGEKNEKKVG